MRVNHELKIMPRFYRQIVNKTKTFEIRKNDRDFKIGDTIRLREYNQGYTGFATNIIVVGIFGGLEAESFGVQKGFVIISFKFAIRQS